MTLKELATLLKTTTYDVAYQSFSEQVAPKMPFICYAEVLSNNFGADGKVYAHISKVDVQLFTAKKDIAAEQTLETVLDGAGVFYEKTYEFNEQENCYRTIYEISIMKG